MVKLIVKNNMNYLETLLKIKFNNSGKNNNTQYG